MALNRVISIDVAMLGWSPADFLSRWVQTGGWALVIVLSALARADELDDARQQLSTGAYEAVIDQAQLMQPESRLEQEAWLALEVRALLALGRYAEADRRLTESAEVALFSLPLRLLQHEIGLHVGKKSGLAVRDVMQAMRYAAALRGSDYTRSSEFQAVVGEASLIAGLDPRLALDNFLKPAQRGTPPASEAFLVSGRLALEKRDYALAARTFGSGLEIAPDDPDLWWGLAASFRTGDRKQLVIHATRALEINPRHVPSHVLLAEHFINAERRDQAAAHLDLALGVNPHTPEAHALRAVLAHIARDPAAATQHRAAALATWKANPRVDHLIGRKLSEQYQFADGAAAQRRALDLDPRFTPARVQLAQDLLRLGREEEGWPLAAEAHAEDAYNVEAFNLTTLRDQLAGFTILTSPNFRVRMSQEEAPIYGDRVVALLERAHAQLSERYGLKLPEPTLVEIYPNPKDFAVRTFGMPDIGGFLGVCFGPVFTINSPASAQANWEAVLWHEFTHVITLTLTHNRMPRWLSEGISVYEERQENPAWGQLMSLGYRDRIIEGRVQPISRMSAAFLEAQDARDTQFAYFQSALVVEFLVEQYGFPQFRAFLQSLADGREVNAALAEHFAPVAELDSAFETSARKTALALGPGLDFRRSGDGLVQQLARNLSALGGIPNVHNLLDEAREAVERRDWAVTREKLTPLTEAQLYLPGTDNFHTLLARASAELGDTAGEREALTSIATHEGDALSAVTRLHELARAAGDWTGAARWAEAWLAINPLAPTPWRTLLDAHERTGQRAAGACAGEILLRLEPPDFASIHYRVAQQLLPDNPEAARRHALQALEEAPRFRAAYDLLASLPSASGSTVPAP